MKRIALAGACAFVLFSGAFTALAYSSPGAPTGFVNDFARVLAPETVSALEAELTAFAATTTSEITVVTIPSMQGDYIENYAVKLFAEWGIGNKDKDNGVLLLLSIEERKLRIEVGYGLEGALPDSVAQRILNNEMTPRLKKGDYDGAVAAGVRAIEAATRGEYTGSSRPTSNSSVSKFVGSWAEFIFFLLFIVPQILASILARSKSWWAGGVVGVFAGIVLSLVFSLAIISALVTMAGMAGLGTLFDYIVSNGYQSAKARGVKPPWWAGGSLGSGRGSGGGGGFGGFGGGSSGGGGASGGW